MKTIPISVQGAVNIPLSKLRPIQGDLKELAPEDFVLLREKILSGVKFVFHVWKENKKNDWWYIIDGHGRDIVLRHLVERENFKEPKIPCAIIEGAKTIKEAKLLVLDSTSTFHRVRGQGLFDFMKETNLKPIDLKENFRLIEVDIPKFEATYFGGPVPKDSQPKDDGSTELDRNSFTVFKQQCPKCGFSFDDNKESDD